MADSNLPLDDLAGVLAGLFTSYYPATQLLEDAGAPMRDLPPFGTLAPLAYWNAVVRHLHKGGSEQGSEKSMLRLVNAALARFPGNRDLPKLLNSFQDAVNALEPPVTMKRAALVGCDLRLTVAYDRREGRLTYQLDDGDSPLEDSLTLDEDGLDVLVDQRLKDLDKLYLRDPSLSRLRGICHLLGEDLLPGKLLSRLFAIGASKNAQRLEILSDIPFIPWEALCYDDVFLGDAFIVNRAIPEFELPEHLALRRIVLTGIEGEEAHREIEHLAAQLGDRATRVAALKESVRQTLSSGCEGWHYVGHGRKVMEQADQSALQLDDYETLDTADLRSLDLRGPMKSFSPLIFANACHTAAGGYTPTRSAGLAQAFLRRGAGAFVGTNFKVPGPQAGTFARTFYDGILAGGTLARAVFEARRALVEIDKSNPIRLAYAVFAHPGARILDTP